MLLSEKHILIVGVRNRRSLAHTCAVSAAAFLLSDMARGIVGEVVHVDAGFSITAGI